MQDFKRNKITSYTKLDHIYYCLVAYAAKDIANFMRHFLWASLDWSGEYYSEESLRGCIVQLTKWKPQSITNVIAILVKTGELERVNANHFRFNPDLANRSGYILNSKYSGNQPQKAAELTNLEKTLRKITRKNSQELPKNQREMEELLAAQEQEAEEMVALRKIDELTVEIRELKQMFRELFDIVQGNSKPEEIVEKVKLHLEIVK